MEAAAKANAAAYQANTAMRHAPTLGQALTAMSSRFAGPADPVTTSESSAGKSLTDLVGTQKAAEKKLQGDVLSAQITALRPVYGGGGYSKPTQVPPEKSPYGESTMFANGVRFSDKTIADMVKADPVTFNATYGSDAGSKQRLSLALQIQYYDMHGLEAPDRLKSQYGKTKITGNKGETGPNVVNLHELNASKDPVGYLRWKNPLATNEWIQEIITKYTKQAGGNNPPVNRVNRNDTPLMGAE